LQPRLATRVGGIKKIWTHILAYNLIRTIIAQSATKHGVEPPSISFKGAIQTLEAFQPMIAMQAQRDATFRQRLYEQLLDAIVVHRVANRPDRPTRPNLFVGMPSSVGLIGHPWRPARPEVSFLEKE
jgi:hypothetical protein